uniref:Cytochrome P450 4c3 n=1 Tax=Cacopsylla melanoneura TaxID=428564 RepID=A0A8D8WYC2_9HEMI
MFFATYLLGLITMYFMFLYMWNRRRLYKSSMDLPGPIALPFIGNGYYFLNGMENVFFTITTLYKAWRAIGTKIARIWLGPDLVVIPLEVDYCTQVLTNQLQKSKQYQVFDSLISEGFLFTQNIPEWRNMRKVISSNFHFSIVKSYIKIFYDEVNILINKVEKFADSGEPFQFEPLVVLATFNMVMRSTLGIDPKAQEGNKNIVLQATDRAMELGQLRMYWFFLKNEMIYKISGFKAEQTKITEILRDYTHTTIREIRQRIKEEKIQSQLNGDHEDDEKKVKSFAEIMLEDENHIEDEVLAKQIMSIIIAGQDTTKSENTAILLMLSIHQDVQDKVVEEMLSVFGPDGVTACPTYEQLQELKYLDKVIKETLRLFPAVPIVGRNIDKDELVGGHILAPDSTAAVMIYNIHRDPTYYTNPEVFDPERFSPEEILKRPVGAYIPFSYGPRDCVGKKYAMLQMKTIVSSVVSKYRVLPTPECNKMQDIRMEVRSTLKLLETCTIRLRRRSEWEQERKIK